MIKAGAGNYSASIAANCLSFYETYFNETYKLQKMDSVAVPEFSGAMGKLFQMHKCSFIKIIFQRDISKVCGLMFRKLRPEYLWNVVSYVSS